MNNDGYEGEGEVTSCPLPLNLISLARLRSLGMPAWERSLQQLLASPNVKRDESNRAIPVFVKLDSRSPRFLRHFDLLVQTKRIVCSSIR